METPQAEVVITWRERESMQKQTIAFGIGVFVGMTIGVVAAVIGFTVSP